MGLGSKAGNVVIHWDSPEVFADKVLLNFYTTGEETSDVVQYLVYMAVDQNNFQQLANIPINASTNCMYSYKVDLPTGWEQRKFYIISVTQKGQIGVRSEIISLYNDSDLCSTISEPPFSIIIQDTGNCLINVLLTLYPKYWSTVGGVKVYLKNNGTGEIRDVGQFLFQQHQIDFVIKDFNPGMVGFGNNDLYELHIYPIFLNNDISTHVFQFPLDTSCSAILNLGIENTGIFVVMGRESNNRGVVFGIFRTDPNIIGVKILVKDESAGEEIFRTIKQGKNDSISDFSFGTSDYIEVEDNPVYENHYMNYLITPISTQERSSYVSSMFTINDLPIFSTPMITIPQKKSYSLVFNYTENAEGNNVIFRGRILGGQVYWENSFYIDDVNKVLSGDKKTIFVEDQIDNSIFDQQPLPKQLYVYRYLSWPKFVGADVKEIPLDTLLSGDLIVDTKDIYKGVISPIVSVDYVVVNKEALSPTTVIQIKNSGIVGLDYPKSYKINYETQEGNFSEQIFGNRFIVKGMLIKRLTITPVDLSGNEVSEQMTVIEDLSNIAKDRNP